ncbi:MAG: EamA rane protein RarD [Blastococcus sp.]|jgi:drug/metabolite transporter (DMT)-like permease|nr:EamA rane protein RarD [Blastococcus sp.]
MGPALCLISAACFGAMGVFGKLAYSAGVSSDALLLLRFTLAAALLGGLLAVRPQLRSGRPAAAAPSERGGLPRRLVLIGLALGAVGYASQAGLYFAALERIDASLVALVLYTYPALVTAAVVLLGQERLTRARAAAVLVASCGTLLVLLGGGALHFDTTGIALAFGAAAVYTAYILVAAPATHRVPPVLLSALVMTGAAAALAVRAVVTGGVDLHFGPAGWLWVVCIAVVSTVVAMLAFFAGLRRTGPSTASILSTFEPVVTTGLAALTLGEFLTPVQLAGGLLVLSSAAIVQLRPRRPGVRPTPPVQVLSGVAPARAGSAPS